MSNKLENDICEINNNKNKFLDRLTSPLLNQRKNKIDINKEPYNQFRVKKIISNNNQPNLCNNKMRNNFLLSGLISNEEFNYKNINNYDNNISLNNVGNYSAIKTAYSENNYINPNNLNLINKSNYKNQSIKNRTQCMQRKSYSDINFKVTQFQQYNSLNSYYGNNNMYKNDKISHINYSDGKKRKYNHPNYTNSLSNYNNIKLNNVDIKNKRSINLSKQINKNKLKQIQINLNDIYNENYNFITNYSNQYNNKTLKMNHSKTLNNFYPFNINDNGNLRNYLEDQNNLNYYLNSNINENNIY
jgi:hypothetical protein